MSRRATNCRYPSNTRTCVCGAGSPASTNASRATVSCGDHRLDVDVFEPGGVGQRVEALHREHSRLEVTTEVERGAGGIRDGHAGDAHEFVGQRPLGADDETRWRSAVVVDELRRSAGVDPLAAQHGRRRQPAHDSAPLRPQPRRPRPLRCRHGDVARDVDVRVERRVQMAHRALGDRARRQRFASDERPSRLGHGRTVHAPTDGTRPRRAVIHRSTPFVNLTMLWRPEPSPISQSRGAGLRCRAVGPRR